MCSALFIQNEKADIILIRTNIMLPHGHYVRLSRTYCCAWYHLSPVLAVSQKTKSHFSIERTVCRSKPTIFRSVFRSTNASRNRNPTRFLLLIFVFTLSPNGYCCVLHTLVVYVETPKTRPKPTDAFGQELMNRKLTSIFRVDSQPSYQHMHTEPLEVSTIQPVLWRGRPRNWRVSVRSRLLSVRNKNGRNRQKQDTAVRITRRMISCAKILPLINKWSRIRPLLLSESLFFQKFRSWRVFSLVFFLFRICLIFFSQYDEKMWKLTSMVFFPPLNFTNYNRTPPYLDPNSPCFRDFHG